jgi:hypothetical protein
MRPIQGGVWLLSKLLWMTTHLRPRVFGSDDLGCVWGGRKFDDYKALLKHRESIPSPSLKRRRPLSSSKQMRPECEPENASRVLPRRVHRDCRKEDRCPSISWESQRFRDKINDPSQQSRVHLRLNQVSTEGVPVETVDKWKAPR